MLGLYTLRTHFLLHRSNTDETNTETMHQQILQLVSSI